MFEGQRGQVWSSTVTEKVLPGIFSGSLVPLQSTARYLVVKFGSERRDLASNK